MPTVQGRRGPRQLLDELAKAGNVRGKVAEDVGDGVEAGSANGGLGVIEALGLLRVVDGGRRRVAAVQLAGGVPAHEREAVGEVDVELAGLVGVADADLSRRDEEGGDEALLVLQQRVPLALAVALQAPGRRQPCWSGGTEWMPTRMTCVWMLPWLITHLRVGLPAFPRVLLQAQHERPSVATYSWYLSPRAISHRR